MFSDSSGPAHASEIVIGIFDAYREKMKTDLGYDVTKLNDRYRGLRVLNKF